MICQSVDTALDEFPPIDTEAMKMKCEIVTCAKARFMLRTLGFPVAFGYLKSRVSDPDIVTYWLWGVHPYRRAEQRLLRRIYRQFMSGAHAYLTAHCAKV